MERGLPSQQSEGTNLLTRKLLELRNKLTKVLGCKINVQNCVVFLYSNNELSKRECKKRIPFYNCIKKNKLPGNKLNQGDERPTL